MTEDKLKHAKYFMFGYISGMTGILASHPFDTVKTCIQSNRPIPLSLSKLYRGLLPPLFGVGLEKAVVFGTFQNTIKHTESNIISGALAGLSASVVVTPFERMKILIQTGQTIEFKSLFQGLSATWSREVPGFAVYFSVYNNLKDRTPNLTPIHSFAYGTMAGVCAWSLIYPQDRIKTLIQASRDKHIKFSEGLSEIMKDGYRGLYKGFSFCLLRVVPLHGTVFMTMELLKKYFNL